MKRQTPRPIPTTRRVVIYPRVSTLDQADSGLSLEHQQERMEAWVKAMGYQLVAIDSDRGESAGTLQRPGLQRALQRLRAGEADMLVVYKLDRLTRNLLDLAALVKDYFTETCSLVSVMESIDTSTATGRLIVYVIGLIAQWEREVIGERVGAAMRVAARRGQTTGRLPLGYRSTGGNENGQGKTVEVDPDAAKTVREIFEGRALGESLNDLARAHSLGMSTVRTLLSNEAYLGKWEWGGDVYERPALKIVPEKMWQAVRALDLENRPKVERVRERKPRYALTGLLTCRECGRKLIVTGGKRWKGGERLNYFTCDAAKRRMGCSARELLRVDQTTAAVVEALQHLLQGDELSRLEAAIQREHARRRKAQGPGVAEQRAKLEAAIERLVDLEAEGASRAITEKRKKLEAELDQLQPDEDKRLPSWDELKPQLGKIAAHLQTLVRANNAAGLNQFFRLLTSGSGWKYEMDGEQPVLRTRVEVGVERPDLPGGVPTARKGRPTPTFALPPVPLDVRLEFQKYRRTA